MKIFCSILTLLICSYVLGQSSTDYFKIKNYKTNAVISINQNTISSLVLSDYGAIRFQKGNKNSKYLFQGQEFDSDLGLYIFPSRIYSAKEKRFFQPDPKSQYHSPYLFVGADPINMIDHDGNMGKPLVFML